jgi:alpha-mannosidase
MSLTPEWLRRIDHWRKTLTKLFYTPLAQVELSGFTTFDQLSPQQAGKGTFLPMPAGTAWGRKWEYAWFKGALALPEEARGQRIALRLNPGGDSVVYINNQVAGARDQEHSEITLTRKGVPGERYEILLESYGGHGLRWSGGGPAIYGSQTIPEPPELQCQVGESSFGIWNEEIYQLWFDVETLYQLRCNLDESLLRVSEIDSALRKFTLVLDLELPLAEMMDGVKKARAVLKPLLECKNGSTAPTLYGIGHAHLDVAWLWPLQETERKIARTLSNQLALMAEYPEHRYNQSQTHLFYMLQQRYPELYERVKAAAKAGQIVPEGGMWVEADTNLTSGESLIRQFLYGRKWFHDEFGVDCELLWLPDVFGYSGALPQIMRGCGIKYFATQKIFWTYNGGDPFPYNLFAWEGIDGTQVLAHIHYDYNSLTDPNTLMRIWNKRVQKDGLSGMIIPFGHGDGGGGPTREHLEFLRREADLEGMPRTRITSPVEFFKATERKGPVANRYVGELYFQCHRGTYTSQAHTKANNRRLEFDLREAEMWGSAAAALENFVFPRKLVDDIWHAALLLQFHDILPGSSIHRVYEEAEARHAACIQTARGAAADAMQALVSGEESQAEGLSVFNSLSWPRTVLVEMPESTAGVKGVDGDFLPVQEIDGKTWVETDLPPCGWTSLFPVEKKDEEGSLGSIANRNARGYSLVNELIGVEFNDDGEIISIFDIETGHELAAGLCNHFEMYQDAPVLFDAWDIDSMAEDQPVDLSGKNGAAHLATPPSKVEILTEGPLVAKLRVTRTLLHSQMVQEISLERGSRQVTFDTHIDWQESHKLLKVAFPLIMHAHEAIHEIQFGHIHRPNHRSRPFDAARFEVSNHRWTAVCEEGRGAAILNDSKYGVSVQGSNIRLTLLKSALAPDMTADKGPQDFTYAFYAWNGSFAESGIVQAAYELNVPPTLQPGTSGERSLFWLDCPNVIIDTVKPAEDGSGDLVLRLYESMRTATQCKLNTSMPVVGAVQTNMLEQLEYKLPCVDGEISLEFRPFEVKTIKLSLD